MSLNDSNQQNNKSYIGAFTEQKIKHKTEDTYKCINQPNSRMFPTLDGAELSW